MQATNEQPQFIGAIALQEVYKASLHLLIKGAMAESEQIERNPHEKSSYAKRFNSDQADFISRVVKRHKSTSKAEGEEDSPLFSNGF